MSDAAVFGKLPAHGDFIARGLASSTRDVLDDWLADSLADARGVLGESFEEAFDTARPWRFARSEDDGWIGGVLAPSVDGVGRRYPILAWRRAESAERAGDAAAHCEAAIYDAFAQGWDADTLLSAVAREPEGWADDWPQREGWWTMGSETFDSETLAGQWPPLLIRTMLIRRAGAEVAPQEEGTE